MDIKVEQTRVFHLLVTRLGLSFSTAGMVIIDLLGDMLGPPTVEVIEPPSVEVLAPSVLAALFLAFLDFLCECHNYNSSCISLKTKKH